MNTCCGNCARCALPSCVRSKGNREGSAHGNNTHINTKHSQQPTRRGKGPFPPVPRNDGLIYNYDNTLEGFFSAVFESYERHEYPGNIVGEGDLQLALLQTIRQVETSQEHAMRVHDGIVAAMGQDEYERVKIGFLSDEAAKGGIVYRYIVYSLHAGSWAAADHTQPDVVAFDRIWRQVYNERHRIMQFARFTKMDNGVFFSKVSPNANVVPLVMNHFAGRFNTQPFLIYDETHHLAGIQEHGAWRLIPTHDINAGELALGEASIQDMWKRFYDAICNQDRLNPRLRMSFMPKRLWGNMVEMDPLALQETRSRFGLAEDEPAKDEATCRAQTVDLEASSNRRHRLSSSPRREGHTRDSRSSTR